MGLNILLYKIIKKDKIETWNNKFEIYYEVERQSWFDSLRYLGDKEFYSENEFEYYDETCEDGKDYYRPESFEKCKTWVENNIIERNKERLITVLEKMEEDKNLVFCFSY